MPNPPRPSVVPVPRRVPGSAWQLLSGTVRRWAVDSQRGSRRNAMVAGTALAARRIEREEVEEYLHDRTPRPRSAPDDDTAHG